MTVYELIEVPRGYIIRRVEKKFGRVYIKYLSNKDCYWFSSEEYIKNCIMSESTAKEEMDLLEALTKPKVIRCINT